MGDLWPRCACLSSKEFQQDSDLSLRVKLREARDSYLIHVVPLSVELGEHALLGERYLYVLFLRSRHQGGNRGPSVLKEQ